MATHLVPCPLMGPGHEEECVSLLLNTARVRVRNGRSALTTQRSICRTFINWSSGLRVVASSMPNLLLRGANFNDGTRLALIVQARLGLNGETWSCKSAFPPSAMHHQQVISCFSACPGGFSPADLNAIARFHAFYSSKSTILTSLRSQDHFN